MNAPDTAPALPGRLRAARSRHGWSRETLAHHAGLSWAAVAQIESGRRTNVRPATLAALAGALGVSVDHLLGRDEPSVLLEHRALLYRSTEEFLKGTVPFLEGAADREERSLVATTPPRIDLLTRELGPAAGGIRFEDSERIYRSPLQAIDAYRDFITDALGSGASWVGIVGEPSWPGEDAEVRTWMTYESMFNLLFASSPVTVICPYDTGTLDPAIVDSARMNHPTLVAEDGPGSNAAYRSPTRHLFGGNPGASP